MEIPEEEVLHSALQEKDENKIIKIIMTYTRQERAEIRERYNEKYEKKLDDFISDRLGGDFENCVKKLFYSRVEFDARELIRSLKSFNTDDDAIYEIIMGRPPDLLKEIEAMFNSLESMDLEHTLYKKCDKKIRNVLITFLKLPRSQNENPDPTECQKQADLLSSVSPEEWLSDQNIIRLLAMSSPQEMVLISRFYLVKTGIHIQKSISKTSKIKKGFLTALFYNLIAPAEYSAYKLKESIKGIGTDNNLLERVIVSRYDADMPLIKSFYYSEYKVSAEEDVEDDTSGSYRQLLMNLLSYMDSDEDSEEEK